MMSAVLPVRSPSNAPSPLRPVIIPQLSGWLSQAGSLAVSVADDASMLLRASELRRLTGDGRRDVIDAHCRHLVVIDHASEHVVGTARILTPQAARSAGGFHCERGFWLTRLNPLRSQIIEANGFHIHPDYRGGIVMRLLWSGLGEFLAGRDERWLIGAPGLDLDDGGHLAANLYRQLAASAQADEPYRVWPRRRLAVEAQELDDAVTSTPLVKAFVRAGARLLGEPHVDAEQGRAELPMMVALR